MCLLSQSHQSLSDSEKLELLTQLARAEGRIQTLEQQVCSLMVSEDGHIVYNTLTQILKFKCFISITQRYRNPRETAHKHSYVEKKQFDKQSIIQSLLSNV